VVYLSFGKTWNLKKYFVESRFIKMSKIIRRINDQYEYSNGKKRIC